VRPVPWVAAAAALACLGAGALAYGWLEAGWLRRRVLEVAIEGLPAELEGLRIGHLSDFHLGARSRGRLATELAVDWVAERRPDLVCVTGDLVTRPRGEPALRGLLERLGRPYVVLGNHDVAVSRDPLSRAAELEDLREAVLLRDESVTIGHAGRTVQIAGVDPRAWMRRRADPVRLADPAADLRILLCHFPAVGRRLPPGAFHLVLSGHLHAGQINLPYPGGRIRLAHPRSPEVEGLHRLPGCVLHVSPGTGTTFLPVRYFARPEATELVLRAAPAAGAPGERP
jgi:predicted MPP superfamily phosphohydrolase